MKKPTFWYAVVFATLLGVWPTASPLCAELYKWVDEQGQIHYTDNLFNVPRKHLEKTRTYRATDSGEPSGGDVKLEKVEIGYMVEVLLNGTQRARLVMDTGATSTLLSPELLRRMGVAISYNPTVRIRTANGETTAGWAELGSIEVGGHKQGPLRVIAHDAIEGADGLLGMDFLGAYRVEILSVGGPLLRLSPP